MNSTLYIVGLAITIIYVFISCSPSRSLILDITDSCWHDVFSLPVERDEIRGFRCIDMPAMCDEVEAHLKTLGGLDEVELLAKVKSDRLELKTRSRDHIEMHFDC